MSTNTTRNDWLSIGDVADLMSVDRNTVRGWIKRGELRRVKLGGTVRINRADIDSRLEEHR